MASVRRRGNSWQATYRGPDGRERTKTFDKKGDADRWVTDEVANLNRGQWVDPRSGKTTFKDFAESWRLAQVHRPSTAAQVETNLRLHAFPTFGPRAITSIRTTEVQAWVHRLENDLAAATVGLVYNYVASIFKAAVLDHLIASSPCVKIKLPKVQPKQVEVLETAIVERLMKAVPERYGALVVLGAGTGVRQGEAFGLTVDRINFLKRLVKIDRQLVLLPKQAPQFGPPKTDKSNREIPLPKVVIDALAVHLAQYPVGKRGFVFTNDKGDPISRSRFSDVWRAAVVEAGAPIGTGFHALRHYYASLLIRHGASVITVQRNLGHHDATETLNTYSHLWPDSDDQTRAAIDDVLGSSDTHIDAMPAEEG